jgi:outer membrane protein OmpA-like peptidoglycan-associated protein
MSRQSATQTHQQKPAATPFAGGLLQRQCTCGNHTLAGGECEGCGKKKRLGLQTKLKVNEPGDIYEQEADRIADQVMATPAHARVSGAPSRIQRYSGQSSGQMEAAPASVEQALASPGRPLEPALRQDMEQRFGHDFSRVRVHTDAKAMKSAQSLHASAYTLGNHMVFGNGHYPSGADNELRTLAHELAHVVQQERGGLSPPLLGGFLEQAADAAASAFVVGHGSINVGGASAPGLARQPKSGLQSQSPDKPRSLTVSLPKDEKNLDDAALMQEIKLIEDWLVVYPSSPESNYLRSELKTFYAEELRRMEQREAKGQGPKEGSIGKLHSIIHKGRLEAALGLWPDHKFLTKGTMEWRLEPSVTFSQYGREGWTRRRIQVRFMPNPSFGTKTIAFQQTKRTKDPSKMAEIDIRTGEYRPFYGMDWDPKTKKWIPEVSLPPPGYKSQPSSSTDPAAYLYDEPYAPPDTARVFETVAVVPETGETLGALRWGVGKGAEGVESTDETSAYFRVAVETFYASPKELGPDRESQAIYNVIVDGFMTNDATLTADQEKRLDAIVTSVRSNPRQCVVVGGFGDAMDRHPMGISEQRAQAVASYLIGKGVLKDHITVTGFGATWVRYQPSTKEAQQGRNRRVQLRLRMPEKGVCDTYQSTGAFEVFE